MALNIADIVEAFQGTVSYDRCLVRCTTPERTYLKKTSITEALFSIFGIVMATSGCPVMDFFRPMARFHLPFATTDETAFRSDRHVSACEGIWPPNAASVFLRI